MFSSMQSGYAITAGEISPNTITAPWNIVDEVTTNSLIEEEKAKTEPVYSLNNDITTESLKKLETDFDSFTSVRNSAETMYVTNEIARLQAEEDKRVLEEKEMAKQEGSTGEEIETRIFTAEDVVFEANAVDWMSALTSEQWAEIRSVLPDYLTDSDVIKILSVDRDTASSVYASLKSAVVDLLTNGVKSEDIDDGLETVFDSVFGDDTGFRDRYSFAVSSVKNDVTYNLEFDKDATIKAQEAAASAVNPVEYKEGQNIVVRGEVVTQAQYEVLEKTGLITQTMDIITYIPVFSYLVLIFVLFIMYIAVFEDELARSFRKLAILSILIILAVIFKIITDMVAPNLYMIFAVVIVAATLLKPRQAFIFSVFLSFVLVAVCQDVLMFMSDSAMRALIISVSGSLVAAIVVSLTSSRASSLIAGLAGSVPGIVMYLIMVLTGTITADSFGGYALWTIGGGFLCGIVSMGLLPVFEGIFKIITPAKLIELADPRRTLLKRLMVEAPGTYHHSLSVGNLAEAACEAIGADSLLARAGAYYHDVGKLKNPEYFVENQSNGYNMHDYITPAESARIITAHVTDGRKMAEREKLPVEILNIISEHHGNTQVAFFLHKAKEKDENVDETLFRYAAPRPTSTESAVIMMADSVEAAMRAPGSAKEDALSIIRRIIRAKYNDGQLDFTPITLRDLDIIAKVFADSYKGSAHKRIKYPEEKKDGRTEN